MTSFNLGSVRLSLSHTHIGLPYGFNFNFPTSIHVNFIWESFHPPPPPCVLRLIVTLLALGFFKTLRDEVSYFASGGLEKPLIAGGSITKSWHTLIKIAFLPKTVSIGDSPDKRLKPRGGGYFRNFWGCAAETLEPLPYTRASSAEFCYLILG